MPSRQGEFENSHAEIQSLNNDNILGCSISNTYLKYLVLGNNAEKFGIKSIWLARSQAVQKWSRNSNNDELSNKFVSE